MQSGKFDFADRLFFSMGEWWLVNAGRVSAGKIRRSRLAFRQDGQIFVWKVWHSRSGATISVSKFARCAGYGC